jgi:hypothetical protein
MADLSRGLLCSQGCTAGCVLSRKPGAAHRAGSCEASMGKAPFDLPGSQGSRFLSPSMPALEGTSEVMDPSPIR